jgi:hypothetical protein
LDDDVAAALAFVSAPRPSRETGSGLEVFAFLLPVSETDKRF